MIYLKLANLEDIEAEYNALQKIPASENGLENKYFGMAKDEFIKTGLPQIIAFSKGEGLPEGYVPDSTYFLWNDGEIVGLFKFRHYLNDNLRRWGGHIGYAIINEHRGKGYATEGLRLLLNEVRDKIPEDEIWMSARADNLASQKVMLKNGAYKVGEDVIDGIARVHMRIKKREDDYVI